MNERGRTRVRVLLLAALLCAPAADAAAQTRLTSAASVRLRVAPDTAATVLARLPLGTELRELEPSPGEGWLRVTTSDGRVGWVNATLTRVAPASARARVAGEIVRERLADPDVAFESQLELVGFIASLLPAARSAADSARLALYRLHAMRAAAAAASQPQRSTWSDAVVAWLVAHEDELDYSEPTGAWLVRRAAVLAAHDRFRHTDVADSLAWLAAINGVPGECHRYLACHLAWADMLEGEYLRRHPTGEFVEEAVARIAQRLEPAHAEADAVFEVEEDCPDVTTLLRSLRLALSGVTATRRTEVLEILEALSARCRERKTGARQRAGRAQARACRARRAATSRPPSRASTGGCST